MNRILIIRGGAIGDFVLTLPALKALRERYPDATLEILGYQHIAAIAENRFYASAVRSIEYAALSRFFAKGAELDSGLCEYFASFDLAISYLFDPDGIFEANLRRAGVTTLIRGPAQIRSGLPATRQLAQPLAQLDIEVRDFVPKVFPSSEDRKFARDFLGGSDQPPIALHAGSGSARKNWPLHHWIELGDRLLDRGARLVVVSGEADQPQLAMLKEQWRTGNVRFATNLPLPHLAAVLGESVFVGHDSGISHLAAAAGARCALLFGPTDPAIWAPEGENVRVVRAPDGDLNKLSVETVTSLVWQWPENGGQVEAGSAGGAPPGVQALMRIGIST